MIRTIIYVCKQLKRFYPLSSALRNLGKAFQYMEEKVTDSFPKLFLKFVLVTSGCSGGAAGKAKCPLRLQVGGSIYIPHLLLLSQGSVDLSQVPQPTCYIHGSWGTWLGPSTPPLKTSSLSQGSVDPAKHFSNISNISQGSVDLAKQHNHLSQSSTLPWTWLI